MWPVSGDVVIKAWHVFHNSTSAYVGESACLPAAWLLARGPGTGRAGAGAKRISCLYFFVGIDHQCLALTKMQGGALLRAMPSLWSKFYACAVRRHDSDNGSVSNGSLLGAWFQSRCYYAQRPTCRLGLSWNISKPSPLGTGRPHVTSCSIMPDCQVSETHS
jgi:hypothetical protein